ncbi:MAG TPA: TraR/DksA family transcriptional regulator [Candidatus Eisenbacteria bacterium]|jgi:DnaK suppressor protein|nr:TraR/DksA family transcriptional regulator [Candidatus Eisenbacteria bacterium]
MRKERLAQFKKKLEEKHRQLVEGVGKTVLYAKGPEDDSTKDLGDQAATSYNREFLFELSNSDRRLLKEVGSALQKLEEGNFGDCERCGEAIAEKRLEALPFARYCIECQRAIEEEERTAAG